MSAGSKSSSPSAFERAPAGVARGALWRWTSLSIACAALLAPAGASGAEDEKVACVAKHEEAQVATQQGKLKEARAALITCSNARCPEMVRIDCSDWLTALTKSMPSVVFAARSKAGDEVGVRVMMDGQPLTTVLDGKSIEVDPGVHELRFELPPYPPIQQRVVIAESEQSRVISVFFGPRDEAVPSPLASALPRTNSAAPEEHRPVPLSVFVLGGAAIVSGGVFAGLGASGYAQYTSLRASCAPFCEDTQVQPLRTRFLLADIALGAALGAAVTAGVLFMVRPAVSHKAPSATGSTSLWVAPGAQGTIMGLGGKF